MRTPCWSSSTSLILVPGFGVLQPIWTVRAQGRTHPRRPFCHGVHSHSHAHTPDGDDGENPRRQGQCANVTLRGPRRESVFGFWFFSEPSNEVMVNEAMDRPLYGSVSIRTCAYVHRTTRAPTARCSPGSLLTPQLTALSVGAFVGPPHVSRGRGAPPSPRPATPHCWWARGRPW